MDIPSLFMIPSAVSSGKVHSVFPNSTDADFDFNRDSDATRVNSEGLIERVGYYGSELITNGDFSNGTNNWSFTDANGQVGSYFSRNEVCEIDFTNTSTIYASQSSILSNSKSYKITLDYYIPSTNASANYIQVRLGTTSSTSALTPNLDVLDNWTSVTLYGVSNGADFYIYTPSGAIGDKFYIDNVSVVEITGDRARLNYEIEGGLVNTKPSLLLEPQSTNVILQSQDITTHWSRGSGPTLTSNIAVAPDGTMTADGIKSDESGVYRTVRQLGISVSSNSTVANSYFVKKETTEIGYGGFGLVFTGVSTKVFYGIVDAVNGTVTISGSNLTGTTKVEDYGNYWRICATTTDTGSNTSLGVYYYGTLSLNGTSLSAGVGSVRTIWGMQTELNQSYSTSYIPTNGSTQTRANETCNGAGTSSIFNDSEGILYCEIAALADDGNIKHISLSDGSTNNRIIIAIDEYNDVRFYYQGTGGSVLVSFSNQSLLFSKIAIRYKSGNFCYYINGAKVGVNTSAISFSGLNDLSFNNPYQGGTSPLYGKIRDIRVYNTKEMTDSEVDILLTKITS